MQEYTIKDNFITIEGQQSVITSLPFIDGTIDVYLNGILQTLTTEYTTVPVDGTITFVATLATGSLIQVVKSGISVMDIQVLSFGSKDMSNALYKKYTSIQKLNYNNRYKIRLTIDGKEISWNFVTKMTPMFSTVKKVLEDIGEFIPGFTEEYILSILHRNSWEIINMINDTAASNETVNVTIIKDATNGDYVPSSKAVNNWVKYKTEVDLIYSRYYGMSFNYGSITKTIGDITITKTTNLPLIDALLKKANAGAETAQNIIFGTRAFVGSYVKGSTPYEYSQRGSF